MTTTKTHFRTCPLCEATCGLAIEVDDDRVVSVRGDEQDSFSGGYFCVKAKALADLHHDRRRLKQPQRRRGDGWETVGWEEALTEAAERLAAVGAEHGPDSVALYLGNPHIHNYGATLASVELIQALGTRARFSTASMDHLPHLFASYHLFGHQLLLPVPDIDRTSFLLLLGANPVVSNGSLMTAPDVRRRLKALRARGGRLVVIDPRRTRTAALADEHLFIRPGSDALLLAAMVRTLFEERLLAPGRLGPVMDGVPALEHAMARFAPEEVAPATGVPAGRIRALTRAFAGAASAVCYGRLGVCQQDFGALSCWLMSVLNALTGNLDRPGGACFTRPAVDVVKLGAVLGMTGGLQSRGTRVRGLPLFAGEMPVAALAEEIDTPGPQQIRALVCAAGNPVLSTPNGARLERALPRLKFHLAIDFFLNETNRHADLILPPTFALERDHYDLSLYAISVRNVVRYNPAIFDPGPTARHDWQIYLGLAARIARARGGLGGRVQALRAWAIERLTPRRILDWLLRLGPYGDHLLPFGRRRRRGLSLARLAAEPHLRDLGPLEPCLPERLYTHDRHIQLAPDPLIRDTERLQQALERHRSAAGELVLVGRRQLRNNNSWMHQVPFLMAGRPRCTLLMNPEDAQARQLPEGAWVEVRTRVGAIEVPVEITPTIMPGVVCLPHGFGHRGRRRDRSAAGPDVAAAPDASVNDITDDARVDELSGTASFSGLPVSITRIADRA